jgi:hypothetical protein
MRFFCLWSQKLETSRAPWRATWETNCPWTRHVAVISMTQERHRALLYRQLHSARAPVPGRAAAQYWGARPIRRIERGLVLSIRTAAPACMPIFSDHSRH